jgi:hypothetical protein
MKDINPPIALAFFGKRNGNFYVIINKKLFKRFNNYKLILHSKRFQ